MSKASAKALLERQEGDPSKRYITPTRVGQVIDVVYQDLPYVSVLDFGATGDGETDDRNAIQAAIASLTNGGRVVFPAGTYMVSAPLNMSKQVALVGVHEPRYDPDEVPTSICSIRCTDDFTGTGLIKYASGAAGVTIRNLALIGPGEDHSSAAHCIQLPEAAAATGELAWVLDRVTIAGFPGDGIHGHGWVMDLSFVHISRCNWGIKCDGTNALLDTRIVSSMVYFCRAGGMLLNGSRRSGQVVVMGSRFERSGNTYGDPGTPLTANAPGIRLGNAQDIQLLGVSTDANTGPGLWIEQGFDGAYVYSIQILGCAFTRDAGGDQVTPTGSGVLFKNASHIKMANSNIGYGRADDTSESGPITPVYGFEIDHSTSCDITDCRIETETFANSLKLGTANYGTTFRLSQHGLLTLPVVDDPTTITAATTGTLVYSPIKGKPQVYTGSAWKDAMAGDGVNPLRLGKSIDLSDTTADYKSIRFFTEDYATAVAALIVTPTGQVQLDQYDADGEYLRTSMVVRTNGFVDTNDTGWTDLSASCTTAFQTAHTVQIRRVGWTVYLSIIYGGGTATGTTVCATNVIPSEYLPDYNVRLGIVAPWVVPGSPVPAGWARLETDGSVTLSATTEAEVHCQMSWVVTHDADWPTA